MEQFLISVFSDRKKKILSNSHRKIAFMNLVSYQVLQNIKQLDDGDDDDAFVIVASITNGFYDRCDCNGNGFIVFCVA